MLIDFHTHCFPDKLAAPALAKLAALAKMTPYTEGTVFSLREKMREYGVDRAVVCNIATNPRQQTNVNNFAIEINDRYNDLISLGSVHPESDNIESELTRLQTAGINGIKLHPDYMGYAIDDPIYEPIFGGCSERGMFVIIHAGFDVVSPDFIHATPERIKRVLERFPRLRLIAAHFGANCLWDDVLRCLAGENVYLDTSLACEFGMKRELAEQIIRAHDSDKLLFASDLPWSSPAKAKNYIESLNISEETREKIFHRNAECLLGEN